MWLFQCPVGCYRCMDLMNAIKLQLQLQCSLTFFRKLHRLWDHSEKRGGVRGAKNDVTIWRIRVACWISKATCTYVHAHAHASEYPHAQVRAHTHALTKQWVILIAFPRQVIRERALILRYAYFPPLVVIHVSIIILRCEYASAVFTYFYLIDYATQVYK
jgi:hypothetical protein